VSLPVKMIAGHIGQRHRCRPFDPLNAEPCPHPANAGGCMIECFAGEPRNDSCGSLPVGTGQTMMIEYCEFTCEGEHTSHCGHSPGMCWEIEMVQLSLKLDTRHGQLRVGPIGWGQQAGPNLPGRVPLSDAHLERGQQSVTNLCRRYKVSLDRLDRQPGCGAGDGSSDVCQHEIACCVSGWAYLIGRAHDAIKSVAA